MQKAMSESMSWLSSDVGKLDWTQVIGVRTARSSIDGCEEKSPNDAQSSTQPDCGFGSRSDGWKVRRSVRRVTTGLAAQSQVKPGIQVCAGSFVDMLVTHSDEEKGP